MNNYAQLIGFEFNHCSIPFRRIADVCRAFLSVESTNQELIPYVTEARRYLRRSQYQQQSNTTLSHDRYMYMSQLIYAGMGDVTLVLIVTDV